MLRIVSYNVRRFTDACNTESTVEKIGQALAKFRPTVVCLNEVDTVHRPQCLERLAQILGSETPYDVNFYGHVRNSYGNAILTDPSVVEVRDVENFDLPGGTEFEFPPGTRKFNGEIAQAGEKHRIQRGMLRVNFAIKAEPASAGVNVFVTHLDHISEAERHTQLAFIRAQLQRDAAQSTVLAGDLNALQRTDYSSAEWAVLEVG